MKKGWILIALGCSGFLLANSGYSEEKKAKGKFSEQILKKWQENFKNVEMEDLTIHAKSKAMGNEFMKSIPPFIEAPAIILYWKAPDKIKYTVDIPKDNPKMAAFIKAKGLEKKLNKIIAENKPGLRFFHNFFRNFISTIEVDRLIMRKAERSGNLTVRRGKKKTFKIKAVITETQGDKQFVKEETIILDRNFYPIRFEQYLDGKQKVLAKLKWKKRKIKKGEGQIIYPHIVTYQQFSGIKVDEKVEVLKVEVNTGLKDSLFEEKK